MQQKRPDFLQLLELFPQPSFAMAMPVAAMKHLLVRPAVAAPLDPNFAPLVLAKRKTLRENQRKNGDLRWRSGVEQQKTVRYERAKMAITWGCSTFHLVPRYLKAVAAASGAWEGILGSVLKGSPVYLEWALPRADPWTWEMAMPEVLIHCQVEPCGLF